MDEKENELLPYVHEDDKPLYWVFLMIKSPMLKELARRSMKLKEQNIFEKGIAWITTKK